MFLDFYAGGVGGTDQLCFYDRGIACGLSDLIEAHKWFNLAAMSGDDRAAAARAEIAMEMTAREVVEAQRRARAFIAENTRLAA
jgi:TPR repeat protein